MFLDELLALHEEPARAHGRVVDAPLVGLEHLDDQGDNGLGRVELAALLPFRQGELAEEVFVDMAEDILGLKRLVDKGNGGDEVDQFAQLGLVNLQAAVLLVEHPFQLGVVLLDGVQGVVDQTANAADLVGFGFAVFDLDLRPRRQLGVVLQIFPTPQRWHPEDVLLSVIVADLQL